MASDPANVRDGVIAVPTYRLKTVFTVSDIHIRYSAVVCAIPLGFSVEPEVYNMNKKSFPEEVGPHCDFLLAHTSRTCVFAVSASVRRKTKHVVRKGRSAMAASMVLSVP